MNNIIDVDFAINPSEVYVEVEHSLDDNGHIITGVVESPIIGDLIYYRMRIEDDRAVYKVFDIEDRGENKIYSLRKVKNVFNKYYPTPFAPPG